MTKRIITEVGYNIGKFVASCPSKFAGVWREYFRVRVSVAIDVTKPLKCRMKIKKAEENWY